MLQFSCFVSEETLTHTQQQVDHIKNEPPETLITNHQACSPVLIPFIINILVKVVEVFPPVVCQRHDWPVCCRRRKLKASRWEFFFFFLVIIFDRFNGVVPPRRQQVTSHFSPLRRRSATSWL